MIIRISGKTFSGKTSVANQLVPLLRGTTAILDGNENRMLSDEEIKNSFNEPYDNYVHVFE